LTCHVLPAGYGNIDIERVQLDPIASPRRGYGIELDPGYVDLTISRWQKMTDQPAMHASGKTFAEICVERQDGNAQSAAMAEEDDVEGHGCD
jgi:hypothetical protein